MRQTKADIGKLLASISQGEVENNEGNQHGCVKKKSEYPQPWIYMIRLNVKSVRT